MLIIIIACANAITLSKCFYLCLSLFISSASHRNILGAILTIPCQVLDYEADQSYTVRVVALDRGSPALSSTLTLSVIVQDTNDNQPEFEKEFYEIDVDETLPKDSQILSLNARDLDKGKNGRLTYAIIEADDATEEYVGILPNSGILFLKQQLDREQVAGLAFSVRVMDHGTPQLGATARVKLNTVDMNDNAPTFSRPSYEFAVAENLAPDTLVGVVAAADGDTGRNGEISFSLKTASSQFRIESSSGRTAGLARPGRCQSSILSSSKYFYRPLFSIRSITDRTTISKTFIFPSCFIYLYLNFLIFRRSERMEGSRVCISLVVSRIASEISFLRPSLGQ